MKEETQKKLTKKNKEDILKLNDDIMLLWESGKNVAAKEKVMSVFSNRKLEKNRFFYLKNALIFSEKGDHVTSYKLYKKSVEIFPDDELSSLGKYLELIELSKYKFAIQELDRYLKKFPAKKYKTTLRELLDDMQNGSAIDFKNIIFKHCKNNNINISDRTKSRIAHRIQTSKKKNKFQKKSRK